MNLFIIRVSKTRHKKIFYAFQVVLKKQNEIKFTILREDPVKNRTGSNFKIVIIIKIKMTKIIFLIEVLLLKKKIKQYLNVPPYIS